MNFDSTIRYSKLVAAIDESDPSLIGNVSRVRLLKEMRTVVDRVFQYELRFFNELEPGTIESVPYTFRDSTFQFRDNGQGTLSLYQNNVIYNGRVGRVDYDKGIVVINRHVFGSGSPRIIEFTARPISKEDIKSVRNGIVSYLPHRHTIQLNPKQEKIL